MTRELKKSIRCSSCCRKEEKLREPRFKKKSQSYQRRYTNDEEEQQEKFRSRASSEDYKKNIWAHMNDPSAQSTLSPADFKDFMDQVQRHSQPPGYEFDNSAG